MEKICNKPTRPKYKRVKEGRKWKGWNKRGTKAERSKVVQVQVKLKTKVNKVRSACVESQEKRLNTRKKPPVRPQMMDMDMPSGDDESGIKLRCRREEKRM